MVIELNERVSPADALSTMTQPQSHQPTPAPRGGAPATPETIDKAAALYHLHDLCDEGDTLETIVPAEKVAMAKLPPSVNAYKGVVSYVTPKVGRDAGGRIPVAVDGTAAGGMGGPGGKEALTSKMTCHYLLVRLEEQGTDLVVFFNVPHDEFDGSGDPRGLSREEEVAGDVVGRLVQSLEVRDWELFV